MTRPLLKFYALWRAHNREVNAISDEMLAGIGMTRQEARDLLSLDDFPWGEVDRELRRREYFGEAATELGMSVEQLDEIRRRVHHGD